MAKVKTYTVKVQGNPDFCGKGAGGVQFANGTAVNVSERMANWFKEHKGYDVEEEAEAAGEKSLDRMKKDELKAYAAEHNIDLTDVEDKVADILAAIKAAEAAGK